MNVGNELKQLVHAVVCCCSVMANITTFSVNIIENFVEKNLLGLIFSRLALTSNIYYLLETLNLLENFSKVNILSFAYAYIQICARSRLLILVGRDLENSKFSAPPLFPSLVKH